MRLWLVLPADPCGIPCSEFSCTAYTSAGDRQERISSCRTHREAWVPCTPHRPSREPSCNTFYRLGGSSGLRSRPSRFRGESHRQVDRALVRREGLTPPATSADLDSNQASSRPWIWVSCPSSAPSPSVHRLASAVVRRGLLRGPATCPREVSLFLTGSYPGLGLGGRGRARTS